MPLDHPNPISEEFARAIDLVCGRMVRLGLHREAMVELANELACMLSNDSFARMPEIPGSRELWRVMVAIKCHLEGQSADLNIAALTAALQETPTPALIP